LADLIISVPTLSFLNVAGCLIPEDGMKLLLRALNSKAILSLNLSDNDLSNCFKAVIKLILNS